MAAEETATEDIVTIRIELLWSDPPIWREVEVPVSMTLDTLHQVVQAAMGWDDSHLWEFTAAKRRYGLPMRDDWGGNGPISARKTVLGDLLAPRRTTIHYVYDFGDGWEHKLVLTRVRPREPGVSYPRLVAGERNCPPEDCGGIPGFYHMMDIAADPKHPDHNHVKDWLGGYDPDHYDDLRLKRAVGRIAGRRKAAGRRSGRE